MTARYSFIGIFIGLILVACQHETKHISIDVPQATLNVQDVEDEPPIPVEDVAVLVPEDAVSSQDETPPAVLTPHEALSKNLETEALKAALDIVSKVKNIVPPELVLAPETLPPKDQNRFRTAVILPFSGRYAALANNIRKAIDMAVLTTGRADFEVVYIDSVDGGNQAARDAVAATADLIVGPLFAATSREAAPIAAEHQIPMISFSNNIEIAQSGAWIIGQSPESEIDAALDYAFNEMTTRGVDQRLIKVAVIIEDNFYGSRLRDHTLLRLKEFDITNISPLTLTDNMVGDQQFLRRVIRQFANWQEDAPPVFDVVIFCGGGEFVLRVAPALSWHDLDPTKVVYLGTSQLDQPALLREPSLFGSIFATAPAAKQRQFTEIWHRFYRENPGPIAAMGFDAIAIASTTRPREGINNILLNPLGFNGFSGVFRFLPGGGNDRHLELRQIIPDDSVILREAETAF